MGNFYAGSLFECVDQFQYGYTVAGSEIEIFNIFFRLATQHTIHSDHVCFSQVDYIDIVADAGPVGSIVIVAEYAQFLTDTHRSLSQIRDQVLRNTVRQFADLCSRMSTDRVEVAQDDALERSICMNSITDDLFVDLFGITIW